MSNTDSCPYCGSSIRLGDKYCLNCGTGLSEKKEPPSSLSTRRHTQSASWQPAYSQIPNPTYQRQHPLKTLLILLVVFGIATGLIWWIAVTWIIP